MQIGGWRWSPETQQLQRGEERRSLTSLERDLLSYLLERAGHTVGTDELLQQVWNYSPRTRTRAVANVVARLRSKLGQDAGCIVTVYGRGYRLELPQLDDLIGRKEAMARVLDTLRDHRHATVHGPGGVGKTHLVRGLVRRRDRALWVGAGPMAAEAELLAGVAGALDLEGASATAGSLAVALHAAGPALLVIDAADRLGGLVLPLVRRWLEAAPALQVLITSRVLLADEPFVTLAPLEPADAAELFVQRAQRVAPDLPLPPPQVLAIVDQVDRLPLAIELAAARLRVLDLGGLQSHLQQGVAVLGRTLEASLQASFDLLDATERRVLSAAALFPTTFTAEAVAAVAEQSPIDTLDVLDALVRAAMVGGRHPRFVLLDQVRAFARAHAEAAQRDAFVAWAVRQAADDPKYPGTLPHVDAFVDALDHATDPVDRARLAVAIRNHDHVVGPRNRMLGALEALRIEDLPPELGISVLTGLSRCLTFANRRRECPALAARILDLARTDTQRLRARAEMVDAIRMSEGAAAAAPHAEALLAFAQDADITPTELGHAMVTASTVPSQLGDTERALQLCLRALPLLEDRLLLPLFVQTRIGLAYRQLGRLADAQGVIEAAHAKAHEHELPDQILRTGAQLGNLCLARGDVDRAKQVFEELSALAHQMGDPIASFAARIGLACLVPESGPALVRLEALRGEAVQKGRQHIAATIALFMGTLRHRDGDLTGATADYRSAIELMRATGWKWMEHIAAARLALALAEAGDVDQAQALIAEADATGIPGRSLALARAALAGDRQPADRALTVDEYDRLIADTANLCLRIVP